MIRSRVKELFGLLPQEYVCVAKESVPDHPRVFLTSDAMEASLDVTLQHVLLGYNPLVIAISLDERFKNTARICLSFTHGDFILDTQWRGFKTSKRCIARVEMARAQVELTVGGATLFIGVNAWQKFLPLHQMLANKIVDRMSRKPPSEANVSGNQYEQVRVAYSVPRQISVITVKDQDLMNFFPTDLHGRIGDYYLSSLRRGGMACEQVHQVKRVAMSSVDVVMFKETYQMGKNHMRPLRPGDSFATTTLFTQSGIPVYPAALDYLEMEWVEFLDIGIHRIFLYKITGGGVVRSSTTLAHIHRYYAQWRINNRLSAEYFYR